MIRIAKLILVGFLSLNGAGSLLAQAATSDVETAVAGMEQQWAQAQSANNTALEATFIADTAVLIEGSGKVFNKDQFIADEKATKYTHSTIENVIVHAYGTAAIATYTFSVKGTGSDGKTMDVHSRATDTWVKMPSGKWQLVASVSSPVK